MDPDLATQPNSGDEDRRTAAPDAAAAPAAPGAATAPGDGPLTVGRRRFLRWLLSFSVVSTAAMVVTPVLGFLVPPRSQTTAGGGKVPVAKLADLPIGQGKVVALGSKPALVVNTDQGVKAYSAICTHLGCIVAWDAGNGTIVCPCHDGRFSPASGAVISGPPPAPLAALTTTIEDEEIFLVPS
jgi:cytochrome b6-f complex iron-sulfur subunit